MTASPAYSCWETYGPHNAARGGPSPALAQSSSDTTSTALSTVLELGLVCGGQGPPAVGQAAHPEDGISPKIEETLFPFILMKYMELLRHRVL